jgi:hypothetical protein
MKIANRVCPVVVGFLTALVLAVSALLTSALLTACLNPIAFTLPEDLSAGVTSHMRLLRDEQPVKRWKPFSF